MNISKINSDGSLEINIVSYSLNNPIDALVCYLEQFVNNNYNTWEYINSKFRNKIQTTKCNGACYYIVETNESYYANRKRILN